MIPRCVSTHRTAGEFVLLLRQLELFTALWSPRIISQKWFLLDINWALNFSAQVFFSCFRLLLLSIPRTACHDLFQSLDSHVIVGLVGLPMMDLELFDRWVYLSMTPLLQMMMMQPLSHPQHLKQVGTNTTLNNALFIPPPPPSLFEECCTQSWAFILSIINAALNIFGGTFKYLEFLFLIFWMAMLTSQLLGYVRELNKSEVRGLCFSWNGLHVTVVSIHGGNVWFLNANCYRTIHAHPPLFIHFK